MALLTYYIVAKRTRMSYDQLTSDDSDIAEPEKDVDRSHQVSPRRAISRRPNDGMLRCSLSIYINDITLTAYFGSGSSSSSENDQEPRNTHNDGHQQPMDLRASLGIKSSVQCKNFVYGNIIDVLD